MRGKQRNHDWLKGTGLHPYDRISPSWEAAINKFVVSERNLLTMRKVSLGSRQSVMASFAQVFERLLKEMIDPAEQEGSPQTKHELEGE